MNTHPPWPDTIDSAALILFALGVVLLPACGYWLMVLDIRRYLRALKGMLVRVAYHFPSIPKWARNETPACLRALNLKLPCTIADVKTAYWSLAQELHPDRGGDRHRFLELQRHFQSAIQFLQAFEADMP